MNLADKSDASIDQLIANHVRAGATDLPAYRALLEERARRAQKAHKLDLNKSLQVLMDAARKGVCVAYRDLAAAGGADWKQVRHQMNGPNGHLDRLLDLCHARGLPLLTAICVNLSSVTTGELEGDALIGFAAGARRLGIEVTDDLLFHHRCRDQCWRWGRAPTTGSA